MNVWDDLATVLGRAQNVITSDELKGLSSILSHELVSQHIHKLAQVLGESLRITTDYLNVEERVVVATSKVESVEVECSQLKKDLIVVMNERNEANEKIKELTEALHVEKALINTEVLEEEAKELEEAESGAVEKDKAIEGKDADESTTPHS
nr:hypothetical protein CFP56_48328 [Quercus suber]